jgi:hypothetical protein
MVERRIVPELEELPIQGVAAILVVPSEKIYTIRETMSRPEYGKMEGMRTIPMETVESGEDRLGTLRRLIKEEVGEGSVEIDRVEKIGIYGLDVAAATCYVVRAQRITSSGLEGDVTDPRLMSVDEILTSWTRRGVVEMMEDFLNNRRNVVRAYCKSVNLTPN